MNWAIGMAVGAAFLAPVSVGAATPEVVAGSRIAQRECGGCHSVDGVTAGPLAAAPAFPVMRARHAPTDFALLLEERLASVHPRMPILRLDPDELASLQAFWRALEPSQTGR
jgi:mono/diheme cytochrome c family protein